MEYNLVQVSEPENGKSTVWYFLDNATTTPGGVLVSTKVVKDISKEQILEAGGTWLSEIEVYEFPEDGPYPSWV